jgi:8-amino-3,8-dideoxy-alpha-D-manno-octulosonate transaminase
MPGNELFGAEERQEVLDVLESGVLFRYNFDQHRNGHWKARTFEQELAHYLGLKHAHLCSSGSTAVAIAMAACGVGYGDHVIVAPFTYVATVEGILLAGATPVFAEIDETLCLSPEGILKAITPRTRAIALVHMCGSMARLDEILAICEQHNLVLIEDSAQALGATYKGKAIGSFGKAGCFSFDYFKIVTCGEGGAVVTNDADIYAKAEQFSDHGHDHIGPNRGMEKHPIIGFNFRISELNAAVGLAQFRKIDYMLETQRKNKVALVQTLSAFPDIEFRTIPDEAGDAATFLSFFFPDEATTLRAIESMTAHGVEGVHYWYNNNFHYLKNWEHIQALQAPAKLPVHDDQDRPSYNHLDFPVTEGLMKRMISLIIKVGWTPEQLNDYCLKLHQSLAQVMQSGVPA